MMPGLRNLCLALVAVVTASCASTREADRTVPRPSIARPNIILITAEDLSPRLGAYGDPVAVTPNLDAFARESIVFDRAFTTSGVCAPSRSALITGVHQQTLGTMHMRTSSFGKDMDRGAPYEAVPPPDVKAFPELLRRAGYYTLNDVKTDYQFGQPFTVWDESRDGADWNKRAPDQPFFAMINHEVTHESWNWMPGTDPKLHPTAARDAARNAKVHAGMGFAPTDPAKVRVPAYYPDTPKVRAGLAWAYDNVRIMDGQVGGLLARLKREGRYADSIIVFVTDHGDGLPRGKRTIFDSGTRVPLIVRFPDGYGAGTRRGDLVSFVDLAPTILSWAGIQPPDWIQGRNLFGDAAPQAVFAGGDRFDEVTQRFRGVREERYHYIRYFSPTAVIPSLTYQNVNPIMQEWRRLDREGKLTPLQRMHLETPAPREFLFDTAADPDELTNLAADARLATVKRRLSARLDRWIADTGDLGRIDEAAVAERMWPGGRQPATEGVIGCRGSGDRIVLRSATRGASIGWGGEDGKRNLYAAPLIADAPFAATAIRYGYKPSTTVRIDPASLRPC